MYRQHLTLLTAVSAFTLFSLSSCSTENNTLTFKPTDGETHSYQVYMDTVIETDSGFGPNTDRIRSIMLTDYTAEHHNGWLLHIKPTYMHMDFRNGSFASPREASYLDSDIREIMSQGFQMHLDDDMQVADFVFNAAPDDPAPDERDLLMDIFTDEFTRPGVAHDLQLRKGATRQIPADGDIPQVTITLTDIRDDNALITLHGENDITKAFGLAVINIESGWVERATMITEIEEEQGGSAALVRSVMSMYPSDWVFDMDLEYLSETGIMALDDTSDFGVFAKPAVKENVLTHSTGYIESSNDRLNLVYYHDNFEVNALGQMSLRDIQAFNANDEPLELPWQLGESITYTYFYGDEQTQTKTDAYPLGWAHVYEQLTELGYIQATMDWYPQTQEIIDLSVADSTTTVEVKDAKATLIPTQTKGVYTLIVEQGEQVHFDYRVIGATAVGMGYKPFTGAPEWINLGESRLLTVTEYGHHPGYYEVFFDGKRPDTIQLLAVHVADTPAASREISFYSADAINANPYVALPKATTLYTSDIERGFSGFTSPLGLQAFTTQPGGELALQDFGRAQMYLPLTPEQAAFCDITVDNNDLMLQELAAPEGHRLPPGKLNKVVIKQLQTVDKQQQYFYDLEVTVKTNCPTSYQWQRLDWEPSEYAWLVELDKLSGIDTQTPVTELLRRYAFLPNQDTTGLATSEAIRAHSLALIAPIAESENQYPVRPNYHTATVADYLYEEGYLRIAGSVKSILKLVPEETMEQQTLTHRFPHLPDLERTFADIEALEDDSND